MKPEPVTSPRLLKALIICLAVELVVAALAVGVWLVLR